MKFTAEQFAQEVQEASSDEELIVRLNSGGGEPNAGWSIASTLAEYEGPTTIKAEGEAYSMAAYILPFADRVVALDVANILLHRAAFEDEETLDADSIRFRDKMNADLRKKLEAKIDAGQFQEVTGYTLDDLFSDQQRINVRLTAQEAQQVGLVDEVKELSASEQKQLAASFVKSIDVTPTPTPSKGKPSPAASKDSGKNEPKPKAMNLSELKAQHPEIFEAAKKEGITEERERVKSFLAFHEADPDNVLKAIKEGNEFTASAQSELQVKMTKKLQSDAFKGDSPDDADPKGGTDEPEALNAEQKQMIANAEKVDPEWAKELKAQFEGKGTSAVSQVGDMQVASKGETSKHRHSGGSSKAAEPKG